MNRELLIFARRIEDILDHVRSSKVAKRIDFLSTAEKEVLLKVLGRALDVSVVFSGGFEPAERVRATIFPVEMSEEEIDESVLVFKIDVIGEEQGSITHSQALGSIMSLNIDRNVIGDVVVGEKGAYFSACVEFEDFLKTHLIKIGRHNVELVKQEGIVKREEKFEDIEIVVSSMRLDTLVKFLIRGSRKKAEEHLEAGFVRVNQIVDKKPSRVCEVGDVLSIRRAGRFKVHQIKKKTKSGKIVLVLRKSV